MAKKHSIIRIWKGTRDVLVERKANIEKLVKRATGKPANIPLTRVADMSIRPRINISDKTLRELSKRRKRS
jgi:hypothetical protein